MAKRKRLQDGSTGRKPNGRFARGNQIAVGRGPKFARRRAEIQRKLYEVPDADVDRIIFMLVEHAKAGRDWAVHEFFNRTLGRPAPRTVEEPEVSEGQAAAVQRVATYLMTALAIDPTRKLPKQPDNLLIDQASALTGLGLPVTTTASRLGLLDDQLDKWLRSGKADIDAGRRSTPCARLLLRCEGERAALHTTLAASAAQLGLTMLERLDTDQFGRRKPVETPEVFDDEGDGWEEYL